MQKYTLSEYAIPQFKQHLIDAGFEVNNEKKGDIEIAYRRDNESWTTGHSNTHNIWIGFDGPEIEELCLYLETQDIGVSCEN